MLGTMFLSLIMKTMLVIDISNLFRNLNCLLFIMQFENPTLYKDNVIATGLPASPGAAIGQIVFTTEDAEAWHAQGKAVILVWILTPGA